MPTDTTGPRQVTFRGNHDTVKIPDHIDGPIMDILVTQVMDYSGSNYYLVMHACAITRKLDALNQELGTLNLIGSSTEKELKTNSGSQQYIYEQIHARLNNDKNFPHQLLLTGSGGVGKSTVMRELIWRLSLDYLMDPSPQKIIPFSMPLQMLSGQEFGEELDWNSLWKWHESWINELFPDRDFRSTKVVSCFDTQAVCILFDGLDEFLALHNEVSSSQVLRLFKEATKRYRNNQKFSLLTVCRNSLPGVENYVTSKRDVYVVSNLSIDEAKNHFPICSSWLNYVKDQKLMDIVLTPLILSSLHDAPDLQGDTLNASDIIGHSIDSILKRSRLEDAKLQDGTLVNREHLLIALMLIAWAFFKNNLGEVSLNRMKAEAHIIANEWKLYLKEHALEDEYESLGGALALLNEHYFVSGLIQRTLFITTGHNKIRFSNRQWHDYLIALYFKQCLTLGNVSDFGETAFNPVIYRMAGELMREDIITEQIADQVLESWRQTDNSSIVGDVLAFISWTTVPIEPSAVRKLLDQVGNYTEITRIVLLSGFGYRGLEAAPHDRSAKDIRNALLPTITTMADCDACPIGDRIASSIAWCYLKAYAEKFGSAMIKKPWPDLRFNEDGQKKALSAICKDINGRLELDKYTRSLQLAFLSAVKQAQTNPQLLIRSMHYLYFLVMAKKFGAHIIELNDGLDELLDESSIFSKSLSHDSTLPELKLLYAHFQTLEAG